MSKRAGPIMGLKSRLGPWDYVRDRNNSAEAVLKRAAPRAEQAHPGRADKLLRRFSWEGGE